MRIARGNTPQVPDEIPDEIVFSWNAGGLLAAAAGGTVWAEMTPEALVEKKKSWRKLEWLEGRLNEFKPAAVVLSEVTGTNGELRKGLQKWLTRRGYASQVVAGEGGGRGSALSSCNGIVVAARTDTHAFEGVGESLIRGRISRMSPPT